MRARRLAENRESNWGEVTVSLVCRSGDWWLAVADTGVGMSDALLTGPFLDFGSSYWDSELLITEHPGLLGKGFQPVGRFGIGFFSVFMLGIWGISSGLQPDLIAKLSERPECSSFLEVSRWRRYCDLPI